MTHMAFFHLSGNNTWLAHIQMSRNSIKLTTEALDFLVNLEITCIDYAEYDKLGIWYMDFSHQNDSYHYRQNEYLETNLPFPNSEDDLNDLLFKKGKLSWRDETSIREIIQEFLVTA